MLKLESIKASIEDLNKILLILLAEIDTLSKKKPTPILEESRKAILAMNVRKINGIEKNIDSLYRELEKFEVDFKTESRMTEGVIKKLYDTLDEMHQKHVSYKLREKSLTE